MDISLDWFNKKKPGKTAEFLNLEYVETEGDIYKFKVTFPKETSNPMNMVQGGMITAALDDATAMVIISAYEFKFRPLTTDLHVLFHRPVPLGEATIEVKIIKLGKKLATSKESYLILKTSLPQLYFIRYNQPKLLMEQPL